MLKYGRFCDTFVFRNTITEVPTSAVVARGKTSAGSPFCHPKIVLSNNYYWSRFVGVTYLGSGFFLKHIALKYTHNGGDMLSFILFRGDTKLG